MRYDFIFMPSNNIELTGSSLTIQNVYDFAHAQEYKVALHKESLMRAQASALFLAKEAHHRVIYGVNTGFGPMSSHIINSKKLGELQVNLIRSHAVGVGDPVEEAYACAAMLVRLNTLLKGYSGVSEELFLHFQDVLNRRIIPVIPEHGAVGTSGDLIQLAHIALGLIGEGEVFYKGAVHPAKTIFKKEGIEPHVLRMKEGLSLINGTSFMAGVAALLCRESKQLLSWVLQSSALALEVGHGHKDAISPLLSEVRPFQGQRLTAQVLRMLTENSHLLQSRDMFPEKRATENNVDEIDEVVQEVYSLRCTPQILGPTIDVLQKAVKDVEIEINSATDNPIVDWENESFVHGGNFHGEYVSVAMDQLRAALAKVTMLSERRINYFLNKNVNKRFPPFLNLNDPGLTLGLQGLQFVATSTTAQNQTYAYPHAVHSISTNADNQDVVSMGSDSALFTSKALKNAYTVVAIELIVLAQAVDVVGTEQKLSPHGRSAYQKIRKIVPPVEDTSSSLLRAQIHDLIRFMRETDELSHIFSEL